MSTTRKRASALLSLIAGGGFYVAAALAAAPSAAAINLPPGSLVNAPEYCMAIYGDPSPCPPPDHPTPTGDNCVLVFNKTRCPVLP
jgi:hypothetical protein